MFAVDHIQIAIPQGGEAKARAFWRDALGLEELAKPEPLRTRGGLWLALDQGELHLGVEKEFSPARKAHPGFIVDDLNAVAAQIETFGQTLRWDTTLKDRRRFFTEDPFGNRLEFLQRN
ncbi:Predicted dioxygenase of extradiol dioxygenase family [Ruegeria halocynthiae]|uniref:Predicted dioxygenase of extradiol dioxygenase family n=1 Tax=Ruegeria halocynthiae TaxID=985054 RepID=A0A1H3CNV2_9RHOB|nr:VOC family protein [Ruegeria halocynthiae]SDX55932.1 Predicted dioxygenase of extradiol dioxygenase family [Ruegeria halocynthiae]